MCNIETIFFNLIEFKCIYSTSISFINISLSHGWPVFSSVLFASKIDLVSCYTLDIGL